MSIQLSSAELVSRIIADPTFANEIVNYVNNIKPKLSSLATKTHVLEQIEASHEEKIKDYKKLLKKLHGKYEKLVAQTNKIVPVPISKHDCSECIVKSQTIDKLKKDLEETKLCDQVKQELANCKACETKDKLIANLESQASTLQSQVHTCKSCEDKNGFIKDLTVQIAKPCSACVKKDDQILNLTKSSFKQSKEKDSSIKRLAALVKQMEMESNEKDNKIANLNKLIKEELNKQSQEFKQSQESKQSQELKEQSNPSVITELYKQFGNFINITEKR